VSGAEGHHGRLPQRELVNVIEHGLHGQAVDGGLDFVEAADAAEVVPVAGNGPGPGGGAFLLHDQRSFQPRLDASQFVGRDTIAQPQKLCEHDVERLLGAVDAGAAVSEDRPAVFERLV